MFDYVHYKCPECEEIAEDQSKSGPCSLNRYFIGDIAYELPEFEDCNGDAEETSPAPLEIVADAIRYGLECNHCDHKTMLVPNPSYVFQPYKY